MALVVSMLLICVHLGTVWKLVILIAFGTNMVTQTSKDVEHYQIVTCMIL